MKLSLLEQLQAILRFQPDSPLTLGALVKGADKKGFGLILMSLSLPSALPIPAPGYSTPFGIIILIFAWQMLRGKQAPVLPSKWEEKKISRETSIKVVNKAAKFVNFIEKFIRPRMQWIQAPIVLPLFGLVIMSMASLMILPIPLTNTLPAFIIFCVGAALCEEDGALAIFASALSIVAIGLYAVIIYILISQGPDAIDAIKESIKSIFKS